MTNQKPSGKHNISNSRKSKVLLRRKPYIQPFEMVLAAAELRGLLAKKVPALLSEAAPETVNINSANIELLQKRLTYWNSIEADDKTYTPNQVRYELSDEQPIQLSLNGISATELPKRRKLRYGPHDLHEYRGKFFPQLVRSLINTAGLQPGDIVLDPTCGSGTTNVEARSIGMATLGVDLNPLSVFIAKVKTSVFDLDGVSLKGLKEEFLPNLTLEGSGVSNPELRWDQKDFEYLQRWFDKRALNELDYLLVKIDSLTDPIIRDFLKVCLSNIIRSVSWQNIDDLRVRKNVVKYTSGKAIELFIEEVTKQTEKILGFLTLKSIESGKANYEIIEGDARNLTSLLPDFVGKCNTIITSPPYATALPYIDTDRLSLIVLNLLPRSDHRDRELDMIGNREISENQRLALWDNYLKRYKELPKSISTLIDTIGEKNHREGVGFRRRNLPALLAKYFLDMLDSMTQAYQMMKPNGYAFYVVGNNSTKVNGEHIEIPTDLFLWEMGTLAGWSQVTFLNMELLPSRDIFRNNRGSSESLLVFKAAHKRVSIYGEYSSNHDSSNDWDFDGADTQDHLHSLHPYPARFIPQIPRKAILEYTNPKATVLDPFCGCGTTLLEASLLGRESIGIDNNPVACLISQAKVSVYRQADIALLDDFCRNFPETRTLDVQTAVLDIPEYKERDYWFDPEAARDLGYIRWRIKSLPEPAQVLALAVLSSIVVRASFQDSDTRYARIEKKYVTGSAIKWYKQKLSQSLDGIRAISHVPRAKAVVFMEDSRKLSYVSDKSIDLIVTSPPYLNAYDYHKYHRHRIHWISGDVAFARDQEIGKHDTFTKPQAVPDPYFNDMEQCFTEWTRVLKTGGKALIVIGDSIVSGVPVPVGDRFVEIMKSQGFTLDTRWIRTIQANRKSFNRQARIQKEHILLFTWNR